MTDMLTEDLKMTLRQKAERSSSHECEMAIKDCHLTLAIGVYDYSSPYAQKLWYEIDCYRDRLLYLTRIK